MSGMQDVQSRRDERQIEIQKVGVKNVQYPITVLDKQNRSQHDKSRSVS